MFTIISRAFEEVYSMISLNGSVMDLILKPRRSDCTLLFDLFTFFHLAKSELDKSSPLSNFTYCHYSTVKVYEMMMIHI